MWQRVQTLYLAVATILIGTMLFCRFATIIGPEGDEVEIMYHEKVPFLIFLIILFAANLFALCMFKIRLFQLRICTLAAILLVAFQIWLGVTVVTYFKQMVFSFTAVFPIVAAILDIMAARNILIDEAIVQSSTRLRSARRRTNKK